MFQWSGQIETVIFHRSFTNSSLCPHTLPYEVSRTNGNTRTVRRP